MVTTGEEVVQRKPTVPMGRTGIILQTMEDMWRFSQYVAVSGLAPKGMERPESIMVAIQMGAEVGMSPMQALQSIAVINNRPGIFGDAALALIRGSGELEKYSQHTSGEGDGRKSVVKVTRRGQEEMIGEFSVADAKKAGLWGKAGPWTQYPDRMLLFRARGFVLRDAFGDVLKGIRTTEELGDIIDVTATVERPNVIDAPAPAATTAPQADAVPAPAAEPERKLVACDGCGKQFTQAGLSRHKCSVKPEPGQPTTPAAQQAAAAPVQSSAPADDTLPGMGEKPVQSAESRTAEILRLLAPCSEAEICTYFRALATPWVVSSLEDVTDERMAKIRAQAAGFVKPIQGYTAKINGK
jgi:hypothetical protein